MNGLMPETWSMQALWLSSLQGQGNAEIAMALAAAYRKGIRDALTIVLTEADNKGVDALAFATLFLEPAFAERFNSLSSEEIKGMRVNRSKDVR